MVSILICNWNLKKWIDECVAEILKYPPKVEYEIIFTDQGSSPEDGFREWAEERPQYKYIWNSVNMGYGWGLNQGIMASEGKYICILNPDTKPAEGWLDYMVEYLEANPDVGLVGPSTNSSCCKDQHPDNNKGETIDNVSNIIPFVCVVIPKRVLVHGGLLSSSYAEDIEFNQRIRSKGWKTKIVGKSYVWHYMNSSYEANKIGRFQPHQKAYHEETLYPRLYGR